MVTIKCRDKRFEGVEIIGFDKDGTLLDFSMYIPVMQKRTEVLIKNYNLPKESKSEILSLFGVDPDTNKIIKGGPIHDQRVVVIKRTIEYLRGFNKNISIGELATLFDKVDDMVDFSASIRPYPGVKELLAKLHKTNIKIALLTLDSTKPASKHLKSAGIKDYFDIIMGVDFDSPYLPKPAPDMIQYATKKLEVDISKALIFGDDNTDMLLGKNAGIMGCIGVLTGKSSEKELVNADVIIDSVAEAKIV